MQVRLGYVAIALNMKGITSSSSVTFSNYSKLYNDEKKLDKLKATTLSNLNNLYKILQYTMENEIHFYRITSALIPLATHPEVIWNYRDIFKKDFQKIGKYIEKNQIRVDTHPDQFNVINSSKPEVVESTVRNLLFHSHLFDDIEYPYGKMVLHVGSSEGGKQEAIKRFKMNLLNMPREITSRLILENDDKTFTASEVLNLCSYTGLPMVLDVHHHICNNDGEPIEELLGRIFDTWNGEYYQPKLHFSSPKQGDKDRKHADYIEPESFVGFLEKAKLINRDFDIMLECKMKDLALIQLVKDIKVLKPLWKWKDKSTLII